MIELRLHTPGGTRDRGALTPGRQAVSSGSGARNPRARREIRAIGNSPEGFRSRGSPGSPAPYRCAGGPRPRAAVQTLDGFAGLGQVPQEREDQAGDGVDVHAGFAQFGGRTLRSRVRGRGRRSAGGRPRGSSRRRAARSRPGGCRGGRHRRRWALTRSLRVTAAFGAAEFIDDNGEMLAGFRGNGRGV